jgi:3-oxoacyl-[acyl-carrier protein] reductase
VTNFGNHADALRRGMADDRGKRPWVLITGSTRGLGLHLALEFARDHWNIILAGRSQEHLEAAAKMLENNGALADWVCGDLSHALSREEIIKKANDRGIRMLINNAGVYYNQALDSISQAQIEYAIAVNLLAPMILSSGCLATLRETKGMVVNINSMAAHSPAKGESLYAATKAGLEGWSKAWKLETAPVRVVDVFLGAMYTGMSTGRPNPELMIQPGSAARSIYAALRTSQHDSSVRFDSIDLRRGWYSQP